MTERERLEDELKVLDAVLAILDNAVVEHQRKRELLIGQLNRARRLEREGLKNAKQES